MLHQHQHSSGLAKLACSKCSWALQLTCAGAPALLLTAVDDLAADFKTTFWQCATCKHIQWAHSVKIYNEAPPSSTCSRSNSRQHACQTACDKSPL